MTRSIRAALALACALVLLWLIHPALGLAAALLLAAAGLGQAARAPMAGVPTAALVALMLVPPAPRAAPLAIIGDCLATAPYGLGGQFRGAAVRAGVGLPSRAIIGLARPGDDVTVISSGSNDIPWAAPRTRVPALRATLAANLDLTRQRLTGRAVWIVPQQPDAAAAVRQIAAARGDPVVTFVPGRDRVHPRSYGALAAAIRPLLAAPPVAAAR